MLVLQRWMAQAQEYAMQNEQSSPKLSQCQTSLPGTFFAILRGSQNTLKNHSNSSPHNRRCRESDRAKTSEPMRFPPVANTVYSPYPTQRPPPPKRFLPAHTSLPTSPFTSITPPRYLGQINRSTNSRIRGRSASSVIPQVVFSKLAGGTRLG